MDLTEDIVNDICISVMKMEGLLSLSLSAKYSYPMEKLPSIEPFLPPPLLRKLRLHGRLEKLPSWFSVMGNVNKIRLESTFLPEDPALFGAYTKQMGKEFCGVGGFPKLEVLVIASDILEEWTEIQEGAPRSLRICKCLNFRMLPEERLKPEGGEENYKVKHIPVIEVMTSSMVEEAIKGHRDEQ
ncbi:hypothetical protein AQUCO_06100088v1 [Aquilegia coerulea]|uniref:Uncharacterized protein n=1 Tax=Aquilegia coerulea TaxID=218851 RepID=A0A2G5CEQ8_AQUCA|nr:hypothetical protein AQUCO_06100088v1 [Aquilegia coerulea]